MKKTFLLFLFSGIVCLNISYSQINNKLLWESMKYGLFVHFVYGGEYGGMTPINKSGGFPANIDEFAESFDVQKFADDVQTMGFEYVIFTAWHANMGVLYPSQVMKDYGFDQRDHYTSKRDLLGEIMDELALRDIKFSIYTHIFVGHDFHPKGSGYFMYDNKTGIITQDMINSGYVDAVNGDSRKWNDFTNKVFDEMSARYGDKVCAYWFDGTWVPNAWVDKQRMMNTIWKSNPTAAMVANGTASHGLPYSSKEAASPETGEYSFQRDYPTVLTNDVTTWPSYTRHVALIAGGNWWASQWGNPRYNAKAAYKYTVLQAGTNNNGGVGWSFGPFIDGSWEGTYPNTTFEMFKQVNAYLSPVAESIKKTRASTSYVTKEGTKINNLQSGFVATRSLSGMYEYIHVLTPRPGNTLLIPNAADGRVFDSAILLASNKDVKIEKSARGYLLTLPDGENWDELNTVFRLNLSEFSITATTTVTSFENPWGQSKITITNEAGNPVSFTQTNNLYTFFSQQAAKYKIALVKATVCQYGKIETNSSTIELKFSEKLTPNASITGFSVQVNNQNVELLSSSNNANNDGIVLTLKNAITNADNVTVSYAGGNVQSVDMLALANFSNMMVDNLLSGSSPVLVSASVEGKMVVLNFNKNLAEVSANSFTVKVLPDVNVAVSQFFWSVQEPKILKLVLANDLYSEQIVELSYSGTSVSSSDNGLLKPITAFKLTNLSQGAPPVVKTATALISGNVVAVEFDKIMLDASQQINYLSLKANAVNVPIISASVSGKILSLTTSSLLEQGQILTLSYNTGGNIVAADGGKLTVFSNFPVQNNVVTKYIKEFSINNTYPNYTIDIAEIGKVVYNDRGFAFPTLPDSINRVEYVQWANNMKSTNLSVIASFKTSVDGRVYIAHDNRIQKPDWLKNNYTATTTQFLINDAMMTLYYKDVKSNTLVEVGSNQIPGTETGSCTNYVVFFRRAPMSTDINNANQNEIKVFPAVTNNFINVSLAGVQSGSIEVYSVAGKLMHSDNIIGDSYKVSVSHWEPGMYLVKIVLPDFIVTKKLVVVD